MSDEYKYDVAFSFLQRDEPLAIELNDRLQDRVKTFIYTEQQKVVAGTDGEETFTRIFGTEARHVVVLYRAGWGEAGWTLIEQTAIKARAFEKGYGFAKFIPLDEPPAVPQWLPPTQVWIGLKRFGIEGAAAVIESRVAELGGHPHEETVEERATRLEREMQFDARRKKFQWDEGVRAAHEEMAKLIPALQSRVVTVKKSSSIPLAVSPIYNAIYLTGLGRALGMQWQQPIGNNLQDARLEAVLFSHRPAGPGELQFEKPKHLRSMRFKFDLLPTGAGGWISDDAQRRTFSTDALTEYLTKFYLDHGRRE